MPLSFNTSSMLNSPLENISFHEVKGRNSLQNDNKDKPGRDVSSKNRSDIFFPLHVLQTSLTYNHRLDSTPRRIFSLALLSFGFFCVWCVCLLVCF